MQSIQISKANGAKLLSWSARIGALLIQFFIVRKISSEAGAEGFGYYAFLASLVIIGAQLDFGLSIFLQNKISREIAQKADAEKIYSTVLPTVLCLMIGWFILGAILLTFVEYGIGYKLRVAHPYWLLFSGIVYGFSNIYVRTVYAKGNGAWVYLFQLAFQTLLLGLIHYVDLGGGLAQLEKFVCYYYALYGAINIGAGLSKGGGISMLHWVWSPSRTIAWIKGARGFWLFGLIGLPLTQLDTLVIGFAGGFDSLAYYAFITKVFFAGCYTFVSVMQSLEHPKITSDWARGDRLAMRARIIRMTINTVLMVFAFMCIFYLVKGYLIPIIMPGGDPERFNSLWVLVFFAFFMVRTVSDGYQTALLAISATFKVNSITLLQMLISAPLQILLFRQFGLVGLVVALFLTYVMSLIIYLYLFSRMVVPTRLNGLA